MDKGTGLEDSMPSVAYRIGDLKKRLEIKYLEMKTETRGHGKSY